MSRDFPSISTTRGATTRVAVRGDGDNIAHSLVNEIKAKSRFHGQPVIKRVYGNACSLPKWDAEPGFRMIHSGTGKNASDPLLAVERQF